MTTEDMSLDTINLDFILVADGAQSVNGKLYVIGGAWTHLWMPSLPAAPPVPFSVAGGLRVPWNRTNQKFTFRLDVLDADGNRVGDGPAVAGDLEQGRPPGLRPGTPQRIVFAFPIGVEFPGEGRYVFRAFVDDRPVGDTEIEVMQIPQ